MTETKTVGLLGTLFLALLALLIIFQIATGAPYDWVSHNIDRVFNFARDRDVDQSIHGQVASLVNLAGVGRNLAFHLEQVAKDSQDYCIHRFEMFDHGIFETYQLSITSLGQSTRVALLQAGTQVQNFEIANRIPLCVVHGDMADEVASFINAQSIEEFWQLEVTDANRARNIVFVADDPSFFGRRSNVSLVADDVKYNFLNINRNEHIYFLKIEDDICIIPAVINIHLNPLYQCYTRNGQLRTNCIDGSLRGASVSNNLKNFYESRSAIQCNVVRDDVDIQQIPLEIRQLNIDGNIYGTGPLRSNDVNYAYAELLGVEYDLANEFIILVDDDNSLTASMQGQRFYFNTRAEGSVLELDSGTFWSFRTRLGEFEVIR